jgi:hypothetical protein
MDALMKLSRDVQIVLGGTVLYVICSFLDWQSYSVGPFSFGVNEWHGFGVLVALVAVVLLAWEVMRLLGREITLGSLSPGLISVSLAIGLLVLTVIIFLDWSDYRAWPEWLGLVLSIAIAVFAVRRAKAEGVEMPTMPTGTGSIGAGRSSGGMSPGAPGPMSPPPSDPGGTDPASEAP